MAGSRADGGGKRAQHPVCVAWLRAVPGKQGLASWFSTLAAHQNYLGRLNPDAWGFTIEQLIFGSEAKALVVFKGPSGDSNTQLLLRTPG